MTDGFGLWVRRVACPAMIYKQKGVSVFSFYHPENPTFWYSSQWWLLKPSSVMWMGLCECFSTCFLIMRIWNAIDILCLQDSQIDYKARICISTIAMCHTKRHIITFENKVWQKLHLHSLICHPLLLVMYFLLVCLFSLT